MKATRSCESSKLPSQAFSPPELNRSPSSRPFRFTPSTSPRPSSPPHDRRRRPCTFAGSFSVFGLHRLRAERLAPSDGSLGIPTSLLRPLRPSVTMPPSFAARLQLGKGRRKWSWQTESFVGRELAKHSEAVGVRPCQKVDGWAMGDGRWAVAKDGWLSVCAELRRG